MADENIFKACAKCKQEKRVSDFCRRGDGYRASCRDCSREEWRRSKAKHRAANPDLAREVWRRERAKRYAENREGVLEYNREHGAKWRTVNREHVREIKRKESAKRRAANLELAREVSRKSASRFRATNPNAAKAIAHRRRARLADAKGSFTAEDIADILKMQRNRCAICGRSLRGKSTIDHIKSIAKGGTNDRRNLQLVHGGCNSSKRDRDPILFMQSLGRLL